MTGISQLVFVEHLRKKKKAMLVKRIMHPNPRGNVTNIEQLWPKFPDLTHLKLILTTTHRLIF